MKFLYTLIAFLFCFIMTAQNEFITTWQVSGSFLTIKIPTTELSYTYNYTVDFGDGTVLNNQTEQTTHTYASAGTYTVKISGEFPRFYSGFLYFKGDLMTVEQWGDIQWQTMLGAFEGCYNLTINATDTPDLSNVTSMNAMFSGADSVNSPTINNWDVSNVTDMFRMFEDSNFNQPLENWDVSNVTVMSQMFEDSNFNQPLENWDVSNVSDMSEMFEDSNFSQPLEDWDVSNVTDMSQMFEGVDNFNHPLNDWDVSSVNVMSSMFAYSNFNQSLNDWDVSNVNDMNTMFWNSVYNQPLNNWDVSSVTNMNGMFGYSNFNQPLNDWDVSNITDMRNMFIYSDFNQPLNNWDVSNVTKMGGMFRYSVYNQFLNDWDVSNVTNMVGMFQDSNFNQPINNWNVSNVTDMTEMFKDANFNQPLDNWDVSNVIDMEDMFRNSDFNQPLNNWDVSDVIFMDGMFRNSDYNQSLNNWDVSNVTNMGSMFDNSNFNQPLNDWDVSNIINFNSMFRDSNFNQDISSWTFNDSDLDEFIQNSAMDSQNYDLLLGRFVQLGLENGDLDADGLAYCDVFTRQNLENDLNWDINFDTLADDCNINYISGKVRLDEDNNGCNSNDNILSQLTVNTNDGQNDLSVLTDDQGDYLVTVNQGNFDVSMLNLPNYFDASPVTHNISFNDTDEIEDQKDFCITANQSVEDLSIEVFPLDDAIPGFESEYEIIVKNFGTQTQNNVQVDFSFEDPYQSFVSASQSANQNGNSLSFDVNNLSPYTTEIINVTLLNVQPPNLNSGDVLSFDADVSPNTNDINPDDNTVNFDQTVVNSFDPNDKLVTQGGQIPDEKIDEYLNYKIRFQNVGTANAINVVVTDTISDKLDWTTFQPINSSHNYRLELVEQEEINFIFENINLPYEAIDEAGSNGHVSFKIKPKDNVQIGDIIENKAYIFFDFNAPIITNTVSTEIVDNLSTTSFVQAENIKLSPNPADDRVEIINASNAVIQKLQLYSIKGQLINTFTDKSLIDISQLSSGVYILQVETRNNKINKRLIKR